MCLGVSFQPDSGLLAMETCLGVSFKSESAERAMNLVFLSKFLFFYELLTHNWMP
jgi:hypothetical protein